MSHTSETTLFSGGDLSAVLQQAERNLKSEITTVTTMLIGCSTRQSTI